MEPSGGEVAANRAQAPDDDNEAGAGGEDRLSALPDDVLVHVLRRLSTEDAARTSVLSSRWRRVWTLLPVLAFGVDQGPHSILDSLCASDVPLHTLFVEAQDASAQSLAAWLPIAARRISGELFLVNSVASRIANEEEQEEEEEEAAEEEAGGEEEEEEEAGEEACQRDSFELPCFEKATSMNLELGFLGLSMPPAGVFTRLTELSLRHIWFHGPGELGDVVSSPRCPCLKKLSIRTVRGLDGITINSKTLQLLELKILRDVRQVTVVAPTLIDLTLCYCFGNKNQPVVNISAPQLKLLEWDDAYDPTSVHLGSMEHLQTLGTSFYVFGPDGCTHNYACLMLLPQFKAIEYLNLSLAYVQDFDNWQYLMEDMTMLPGVTTLQLTVLTEGHAIGACSFHVLRICSGIKRLVVVLSFWFVSKAQTVCSSGCICDHPTNWKTEDLPLNCLQELEINGLRGWEHEVAFVKRLLNWVTVLKILTVTFNLSVTESKAKELIQMFRKFSRPGVCMKFYVYRKLRKVMFAPED